MAAAMTLLVKRVENPRGMEETSKEVADAYSIYAVPASDWAWTPSNYDCP
jgi:hypothetical protein